MKLRKKKKIIEMFKFLGADIVLHGHVHEQREYMRKKLRFLNAGSSIKSNHTNKLFVNFVDLSSNGMLIEKRTVMPKNKTEKEIYPLQLEVA